MLVQTRNQSSLSVLRRSRRDPPWRMRVEELLLEFDEDGFARALTLGGRPHLGADRKL
jgi:hypothetical protein